MTREEDRISVFLEPSKSADFKIIQRFISKFTKSEEEEYLNPSCFTLKKPLEYDFCVRLIKDLATSDNDDRFEAISCTRYVGVLDFWHFGSFTANDEKDISMVMSKEFHKRLMRFSKEFEASLPFSFIDFATYRQLAMKYLKEFKDVNEAVLMQPVMLLCWNLLVSPSVVFDLSWNSLGWKGDCLTVTTFSARSRRTFSNVYANPDMPEICPILALALKLVSETSDASEQFNIFTRPSTNSSFTQRLAKASNLSIRAKTLRESAFDYVSCLENAPSADHITLRMGKPCLGPDCDQEIRHRCHADNFVGRAVAGLDLRSEKFATLPPHFKVPNFNVNEVIPASILEQASESLKETFPYLIASIIYHWSWIDANLSKQHPFFTSTIYLQNYNLRWGNLITCGINTNQESGMIALGIPLCVKVFDRLKQLTVIMQQNQTSLSQNSSPVVQSQPASQNHRSQASQQRSQASQPSAQTSQSSQANQSSAQVNQQISQDTQPSAQDNQPRSTQVNQPHRCKVYEWDDGIHFCPKDFKLPHLPTLIMWRLWLFGDSDQVTAPYRSLRGDSFSIKSERTQLSKIKSVMEAVRAKIGRSFEEIAALGPAEAEKLFNTARSEHFAHIKRFDTMKASNAYTYINK